MNVLAIAPAQEEPWLFCMINVIKENDGNCKKIVEHLPRNCVWFDKHPSVVALQETKNWTKTDEMKIEVFAVYSKDERKPFRFWKRCKEWNQRGFTMIDV